MTQNEFEYDVFVSYSSADRSWVRGELMKTLEKSNLRVFIDYRDSSPGSPTTVDLERAIKGSRKVLVILTPAYVKSAWSQFELQLVQTLDPSGRERRLIPVLREKTELPLGLERLNYVNLHDPEDWRISWNQLLTALGAPVPQLPREPPRGEWLPVHPYGMLPNFTGRVREQKVLSEWLHADREHPVMVLRALGGFGKTALVWQWIVSDLKPTHQSRVFWWSFYDEPDFDSFLVQALAFLRPDGIIRGPRQQCDELIKELQQSGTLLVLDGFERALRAYGKTQSDSAADSTEEQPSHGGWCDCLSLMAEHFLHNTASLTNLRGKVLITTRLRPNALEGHGGRLLIGCREDSLAQLSEDDAVQFFFAEGIRGSRAEIRRACESYGYHSLSLRILAGLIVNDPEQPGDIAVAARINVSGDLIQRRSHVLKQACAQVPAECLKLLGHLSCFRGSASYEAARLCAETRSRTAFDADLRGLVSRGLVHHNRESNRFDLHAIVRRYVYERLDAAERRAAHGRLSKYFAGLPASDKAETPEDLASVIECYHHTARSGEPENALQIFNDKLIEPLHFKFGSYDLLVTLLSELFHPGEEQLPALSEIPVGQLKAYPYAGSWSEFGSADVNARAWVLNALALAYRLSGQPHRAVPLFIAANEIDRGLGDMRNYLTGLLNLAVCQWRIGRIWESEHNLLRQIDLSRETGNRDLEAVGTQELGLRLAHRGLWEKAEEQFKVALVLSDCNTHIRRQSVVFAHRALTALLFARVSSLTPGVVEHVESGLAREGLILAKWSLELVEQVSRSAIPVERNYVRAHWLIGAAHRISGDVSNAEAHLLEALSRCRVSNLLEFESDILLEIARLQAATGKHDEARSRTGEALTIAERSNYVLQRADAHLFLARLALETNNRLEALRQAKTAHGLAACDGHLDYMYKVARDDSEMMLGLLDQTSIRAPGD